MKKFWAFLKTFLSIILVVICLIGLFIFTGSYVLKRELSEDVIQNAIVDNDFSVFLDDVMKNNQELVETSEEIFKALSMPEDSITRVINSDATKKFIGAYVSNTIDTIFSNDSKELSITIDDFKNLFKENIDILQSELPENEREFLESYEEKGYEYIDEHQDELLKMLPQPKDVIEKLDLTNVKINDKYNLNDLISFISFIRSTKFLMEIILVIVVLMVIIFLLKRRKALKYYSVLFGIYSFLMIVCQVIILTVIKSAFMSSLEGTEVIVNYLVNGLSKTIWLCLLPTILLTIIFAVLYKKFKLKNVIKKEEDVCENI